MRSNEMRPSNRVRSYKNKKPSLLQIIGVKRLVIILVVLVVFFSSGIALLKWKDNKELTEQQQAAQQAELDDNYLNFMLSLLGDYHGYSYTGTIDNANLDFASKSIMKRFNNRSTHLEVSGVCNTENITGSISYQDVATGSMVYYTSFVSNKKGVYYDVSEYCNTSVINFGLLKDKDIIYWNLLDNAKYVSYPMGPFYNCYSLSDYFTGVFESAKTDNTVELAKSQTDEGRAQYSAKIPASHFAGDNPIAKLFANSDSPVICSIYCLGGNFGSRGFYVGFQQDNLAIQLNLSESTAYAIPSPIYAVSEEQFETAVTSIEGQIKTITDAQSEEAKKQEKKNKKKKDKSSEEATSEETTGEE